MNAIVKYRNGTICPHEESCCRYKQFPSVAALFRVPLHREFRSLLRRIEISLLQVWLSSTARALVPEIAVLVGLAGFPPEAAGDDQRLFCTRMVALFLSKSALASPFRLMGGLQYPR